MIKRTIGGYTGYSLKRKKSVHRSAVIVWTAVSLTVIVGFAAPPVWLIGLGLA